MLDASLQHGATLKKIVDAIKELCKEVNLECNDKGIILQAMDSSHVSLVHLFMKEAIFETYRADKTKVLGVSMENMAKIFRMAGNDDRVTIKSEDDADVVQFVFENTKDDKISDFSLKLLDIETEHLGIPEGEEYRATIRMPSSEFQKICRDVKEFGDSLVLSCTKDGLKFTVEGDIGVCNVSVKPRASEAEKEGEDVSIVCKEPVTAAFALRYLNFFTKATPLATACTIQLDEDKPLVIEYELGGEEAGFIRFFLAPKIDE